MYYVGQISVNQFVCLGCLKKVLKYCAICVSHSQFYFRQTIFPLEPFLSESISEAVDEKK